MVLPFKDFPFLQNVIEEPILIVIFSAFGIPALLMGLALISIPVKNRISVSNYLLTIIFVPLLMTWIVGFIAMMALFFAQVSAIKLYLIWLLLFFSSYIFTVINSNSITKYLNSEGYSLKKAEK